MQFGFKQDTRGDDDRPDDLLVCLGNVKHKQFHPILAESEASITPCHSITYLEQKYIIIHPHTAHDGTQNNNHCYFFSAVRY